MAKYLFHGSYTQSGIQGMMRDGGTGRMKSVEAAVKSAGGTLESLYWAFGEDDFYLVADLPGHANAAALAATVGASGTVTISTVVLMTAEDIDAAIKIHPDYRAPGT